MEIIGHRGAPRQHPENSLPGFALAARLGAGGIELDVHQTRDGVIVVHHDPTVRDGTPINTLDAAELLRYPLAPDVVIPTLAEVLECVAPFATVVYVEVKGRGIAGRPIEAAVVDVLDRSPVPTAVHAFDHRVAARVTALRPQLPTGILLDSYLIDPVAALRAAGARDYWQSWEFIDQTLVDRVHDAGGRVIAWTVNAPAQVRALDAMGVDGICSDVATTLAAEGERR